MEATQALREADLFQLQKNHGEAMSAVKRARAILAGGGSTALRQRVNDRLADLEMVARLEMVLPLMMRTAEIGRPFDYAAGETAYREAFQEYGLDIESLGVREAADRIRERTIPAELASALDEWASTRRNRLAADDKAAQHFHAVAMAVDPQPGDIGYGRCSTRRS